MMSRAISFCKLGVSRAIKVSRCYLLNMDKIRRTSIDEATSSAIDELLTDRGFSNREFDRATDGAITYSRIRDIRSGLRGPIRLSEFLIICQTCEVDPVATLREIIEAARVYESRERLPPLPLLPFRPARDRTPTTMWRRRSATTNDTASPPTPTETATSRPRPPTGDGRF